MKIGVSSQDLFLSATGTSKPANFLMSIILGFILLLSVIGFPIKVSAWFDGLPWIGFVETLVTFVLVPFLMILGYQFLSFRWTLIFLSVTLILKIIIFLNAPASGWIVKVYPDMTLDEVKQNGWHKSMFKAATSKKWVKTYATKWHENASGLLQSPWINKKQFPLDWFLPYALAKKNEAEQFDAIDPWIEFEGAALLSKKASLVIIAEGVIDGTLEIATHSGGKIILPVAQNYQEARILGLQAPKNNSWFITGKLKFKGTKWSLIPVVVDVEGNVSSDLGRSVLWQDRSSLLMPYGTKLVTQIFSWVIDMSVCLFFLAWGVWVVFVLNRKQILNIPIATFSVMAVFFSISAGPFYDSLLQLAGDLRNLFFNFSDTPLKDTSQVSHLGFSIIIISFGFLLSVFFLKDDRNFQSNRIVQTVLLLYGPAILIFFSYKWYPQIQQWYLWSQGDDWTAYQNWARMIVVDGEWLNAGEGPFIMQPLYRYFVGVYHWLFGQSAFVQRMADVWCILGATLILVNWSLKLGLTTVVAFFSSITYLIINFIGTFRHRIGEGLVENHAMIFMMLAAWFIYLAREGGNYRIVLATMFGIFGYWIRLDHLGAIICIAFLILEPSGGLIIGWKGYWERFKLRWGRIACYWSGGILSLLLICYRNWWLGGEFFPSDAKHPNLIQIDAFERGKYYLILIGDEWPTFPSISGLVVSSGVFLALLTLVWRFKTIPNFPLSLGVIFIGLLAPYAFLWTGGYEPRFSIHILPLAILSLAYLLNAVWNKYNLRLTSN